MKTQKLCPKQEVNYKRFVISDNKTVLQPVENCALGVLDDHIIEYPVGSFNSPKEVPDNERVVCQYWTGLKCKILSSTPQESYVNSFKKPNKLPSLDDFFKQIDFNPSKF